MRECKRKMKTKFSKLIFFFFLIVIFLFLSYDRLHHWDEICYIKEGLDDSNNSCFPKNERVMHVFIVKSLVNIFGDGFSGLFLVGLAYALFVVGFVLISFLIFKELFGEKKSTIMAIFLLFMPLTLYLSFKAVPEVLSIFFASIGILFFLFSYRSNNNFTKTILLMLSGLFVFFSGNTKIDGPIIFFSFLISFSIVCCSKRKDKAFLKYISHAAAVTIFFLIFLYFWTASTGLNPYKVGRTLVNADEKGNVLLPSFAKLNIKNKVKPLFLVGSLFTLFVPFSLFKLKKKESIFAFAWLFLSILPPLFILSWLEVRYIYTALIPYSIIIYLGYDKISTFLSKKHKSIKWVVFSIVVLVNLLFIPLMETQISDKIYMRLINKLDSDYPENMILLADGYSDYNFLTFVYPKKDFYVVQLHEIHQSANMSIEQKKEAFRKKFKHNYIADLDELRSYNRTKLYICYKRTNELSLLMRTFYSISKKESRNEGVCARGWVWTDPNINLNKVYQEGKYEVYEVAIKNVVT